MWKGSYGVFYPKYPAQPQAKAYADVAKPVAELRPVIDFEVLGGVDPKTAADRALDYIKATEDAWGCACIFYSYPAFISVLETANATTMQAIASRCDLWLAQYTTWANPSVPMPWKAWRAWQFDGDKGLTLPSGTDCDFSWFNGDEVDFLARWKRNP